MGFVHLFAIWGFACFVFDLFGLVITFGFGICCVNSVAWVCGVFEFGGFWLVCLVGLFDLVKLILCALLFGLLLGYLFK